MTPAARHLAVIALLIPNYVVAKETRCGWYHNPTPANYWLEDRDGTWILGVQGGFQTDDFLNLNESDHAFGSEWRTLAGEAGPSSYGYGCACITGQFDPQTGHVERLSAFNTQTLAICRVDDALPPEPGTE